MKLNTGERLLRIAQLEAELDITKDELSRAEANVSFYKTKAREIEFTIKVLKKEGE
jgi:endonuclease III